MMHLNGWFKDSLLTGDWYGFAVKLVGNSNANSIKTQHCGGGDSFALQQMLNLWYNSTVAVDRSWQNIVNALKKLEKISVIESIEKECKILAKPT